MLESAGVMLGVVILLGICVLSIHIAYCIELCIIPWCCPQVHVARELEPLQPMTKYAGKCEAV